MKVKKLCFSQGYLLISSSLYFILMVMVLRSEFRGWVSCTVFWGSRYMLMVFGAHDVEVSVYSGLWALDINIRINLGIKIVL